MKVRLSITIDPKTNKLLEDFMKKGRYRNKSHCIEEIILLTTEEKENDKHKK